MTEEERAELFREQAQSRERAALERWKALAGSASAYDELYESVKPLVSDNAWDPIEYVTETERLVVANG
ncbi:MAG: hypothetical protein DRO14_00555 [Thermoprotei archaeon]|mgnify:CR=1 FL=1|nr:MAG: hypothetical protein DRO14_00555 [Thermoprotei archaeon]